MGTFDISIARKPFQEVLLMAGAEPASLGLYELPSFTYQVSIRTTIREIAEAFKHRPDLPGVILSSQSQFCGMIPRKRCFEALGRPFGVEIYSRQTSLEFYHQLQLSPLILDENTPIEEAVKTALRRKRDETYDPIVIRNSQGKYALVDMHTLLTAQGDLLERLYTSMQWSATRDPLTQALNRRGFFEEAQFQIDQIFGQNFDLSVLMIDIDNFKSVNDVYGHSVGDIVIQTVVKESQKVLQQGHLFGRFGGEEFVVLLSNTSKNNACAIAEQLRSHIENISVYVNGFQVSVTVSIGVCHIQDAKGSLDNLLTLADQAMYTAKWAGRNQVIVWDTLVGQKVRQGINLPIDNRYYIGERKFRENADAARIYDETIVGWAKALELRDKETEGHAQRVTSMTINLARRLGLNDRQLVDVRRGALLHDIGKIAIPDNILFKNGKLTAEEWEIMHKHPVYAYELLSPISYLQSAIDIPYCHHEHWDGNGYPRGLKGEEIPLSARIFTVVDVWDALRTARCYRAAWEPEQVKRYILEESGKLFDPQVIFAFFEILNETPI